MKLALSWALIILLVLLQVIIGKTFGLIFAIPLSVIGIIVLAAFVSTEQLLYMAFVSGLLLDLNSGGDFGLNLSFIIFVAIFCKLVMHFGVREYSWLNVIVLSTLLTTLYTFVLFFLVYSPEQLNEATKYLYRLIATDTIAIVWTIVLYAIVIKIYQSDINFKLNKSTFFMSNKSTGIKK